MRNFRIGSTPNGGRPLRAFINRDSLEKRPPADQASTDVNLVGIITISEYLSLDLLLAIFQVFNTAELLNATLLCLPVEDAICVVRSYKEFEYAITALYRLQCHVQCQADRNVQIRLNTSTLARHVQTVWSPNYQGTTSTLGAVRFCLYIHHACNDPYIVWLMSATHADISITLN